MDGNIGFHKNSRRTKSDEAFRCYANETHFFFLTMCTATYGRYEFVVYGDWIWLSISGKDLPEKFSLIQNILPSYFEILTSLKLNVMNIDFY